jgi:hypothetical protein
VVNASFRTQGGGAGLRLLVVLLVVGVASYLAWGFVHQQPSTPAVATSAAAAESGQQKAEAFANAQAQAQRTGRPVGVVETFDDAELTSLANQAAQAEDLPVRQISLHATGHGTVQGQAQATVSGQTVPVTLEGVPEVSGNQVRLNVTSTHVGALPLPGALSDQATASIRPLTLGRSISGFQDLQVTTSEGQLTVRGTALPA